MVTMNNVKHVCPENMEIVEVDDDIGNAEPKVETPEPKVETPEMKAMEGGQADKIVEAYRNAVNGAIKNFQAKSYE